MMRRPWFWVALGLACFGFVAHRYHGQHCKSYVNIYDWYGMLPHHVLQQFEAETGIHVRYDMYDDNDVLEAKLLASNCGYDVVFPSVSPYVARHIKAGLYQPLHKKWLTNLADHRALNPAIVKEMRSCDPQLDYCIPYYWGTLGILYDAEVVEPLLDAAQKPRTHLSSYALIFDISWLPHVAHKGVSLLAESVDAFPAMMHYIGLSPHSQHLCDLKSAFEHLRAVRPYIKRFNANRFIHDIILRDVCIAQAWSGEAMRAVRMGQKMNRRLVYTVPKEGTTLWIDGIAVPKGAPHPRAAHIFINFLLRPDVSAHLTQATCVPTTVVQSYKLIESTLQDSIFPQNIEHLKLDSPHLDENFERTRTRLWARIRLMR